MSRSTQFILRRELRSLSCPNNTRLFVVEAADRMVVPFSIERLFEVIEESGVCISRSTVYRTVSQLIEVGMLVEKPDGLHWNESAA